MKYLKSYELKTNSNRVDYLKAYRKFKDYLFIFITDMINVYDPALQKFKDGCTYEEYVPDENRYTCEYNVMGWDIGECNLTLLGNEDILINIKKEEDSVPLGPIMEFFKEKFKSDTSFDWASKAEELNYISYQFSIYGIDNFESTINEENYAAFYKKYSATKRFDL